MEERKPLKGYGETRRKSAKLELLKICEQLCESDTKTRILALFSLRTGYSMKRAEEYLEELVDVGVIEVNGELIKSTKRERPVEVKEQ